MSRLLLLTLLALLVWYYFPETRAMLFDVAEPVVAPVMRWGTEEEMRTVGRNAVDHERLTGTLPSGERWLEWLASRYAAPEAYQDPWGSTYQLVASKDTVWVLSFGPDRTRNTEDDFRVGTARDL